MNKLIGVSTINQAKQMYVKIIQIMRLTAVLLLVTLMQVSATGLAQKISLSETDVPLKTIFKKIRTQSGYDFVYAESLFKGMKPVSINIKNAGLEEVLDQIFNSQPLTYSINNRTVTVKEKIPSLLDKAKSLILELVQDLNVRGRVVDEKGEPLIGASVKVKGSNRVTTTNDSGMFNLTGVSEDAMLEISYLGYKVKEIIAKARLGDIKMESHTGELEEVLVSTGYQTLPKERATGAFVQIDQTLLERRVSTSVLSRLEDVTSGLIFNKTANSNSAISIRGQNTLFTSAMPLIILDNYPFEGDLNNINPNDVESITILKDAAAASIWGAKAGNGVIVINSKKGNLNTSTKVNLTSSVQMGEKPDLFYYPLMSVADYIETEKKLFANGYYASMENSLSQVPLSPVVELLIAKRDGKIDGNLAEKSIEDLKAYNLRNDQLKYLNQYSLNQQYALNLSGGGANHHYYLSSGFDQNRANEVANSNNRFTINANQTSYFLDQKLELNFKIGFLQYEVRNNNQGLVNLQPYTRLVDNEGTPIAVTSLYRNSFKSFMQSKGFQDWSFNPINDVQEYDNRQLTTEFRINASAGYKVTPALRLLMSYQYSKNVAETSNLQKANSYNARNLINEYTTVNPDNSIILRIPLGGIKDLINSNGIGQGLRALLNYDKTLNTEHNLTAIAGAEIRQLRTTNQNSRLYGFSEDYQRSAIVDYLTRFPLSYNTGNLQTIPYRDSMRLLTDRFLSYFANAAYTYMDRYVLSGSVRFDQSNLFGVDANQKGVPLFSGGLAWNISKEGFYQSAILPYLKMRMTYGYSGNIFKSLSSYTTASYSDGQSSPTRLPFQQIENPPNPALRWEKVGMFNVGLDFGFVGNRIGNFGNSSPLIPQLN